MVPKTFSACLTWCQTHLTDLRCRCNLVRAASDGLLDRQLLACYTCTKFEPVSDLGVYFQSFTAYAVAKDEPPSESLPVGVFLFPKTSLDAGVSGVEWPVFVLLAANRNAEKLG